METVLIGFESWRTVDDPVGYAKANPEGAILVVWDDVTVVELRSALTSADGCAGTACDLLKCVGVQWGFEWAQVFDGGLHHLGMHDDLLCALDAARAIMAERAAGGAR